MPKRSWDVSCKIFSKELEYDSLKDDSLRQHWAHQLYRQRNGFSTSHSRLISEILERAAHSGLPASSSSLNAGGSKNANRSEGQEVIGPPLVPFSGIYSTHAVIRPRSKLEPNEIANKQQLRESYRFRPPIIFPHQRLPQPRGSVLGPDNFRSLSVEPSPSTWPTADKWSSSTDTSLPDIRRPAPPRSASSADRSARRRSADLDPDGASSDADAPPHLAGAPPRDEEELSPQGVTASTEAFLRMRQGVVRERSRDAARRAAERAGRAAEESLQQRRALLEMRKRAEREASDARLKASGCCCLGS
jgi:hypothetical protein